MIVEELVHQQKFLDLKSVVGPSQQEVMEANCSCMSPFQLPHTPIQVPKYFEGLYSDVKNEKRRKFLGMVSAMYEAVGRIIRTLKSNNTFEETLFIFMSDNGCNTAEEGNNWPLRGRKNSLWTGSQLC